MKKIFIFLMLLAFVLGSAITPRGTQALGQNPECSNLDMRIVTPSVFPRSFVEGGPYTQGNGFQVVVGGLQPGGTYKLQGRADFGGGVQDSDTGDEYQASATANGQATFYIKDDDYFKPKSLLNIAPIPQKETSNSIFLQLNGPNIDSWCNLVTYSVFGNGSGISCGMFLEQSERDDGKTFQGCFEQGTAQLTVKDCSYPDGKPYTGKVRLERNSPGLSELIENNDTDIELDDSTGSKTINVGIQKAGDEQWFRLKSPDSDFEIKKISITVQNSCPEDFPPVGSGPDSSGANGITKFEICDQIPSSNGPARQTCQSCLGQGGLWTAVGCISTEPTKMIQSVLMLGLSIAGGTTILLGLASGFMFSVSKGDPKATSDAKDLLTSAVIGLLFIIFSVTILQFIGYSVLRVPGFGG